MEHDSQLDTSEPKTKPFLILETKWLMTNDVFYLAKLIGHAS
jgi:hypothetical protein